MTEKLGEIFARRRSIAPIFAASLAAFAFFLAASVRAAEDPAPVVERGDDISLFGSYLAGRQASGDRDRRNAADFFANALKRDPENRMLLERTMVYQISSGRFDEAVALAPTVLDAAPNNLGANVLLGLKAMRDGNYAGARARFATNDSGPIARLASELLNMWAYQAGGEAEEAQKTVDGLDEAASFGAFRTYHAGLLAEMQGRTDDAENAYSAAHEAAPGLRTVDAYGRFLESHGRQGKAVEIYRAFLEESPNHPIISAALARAESGEVAEPLIASAFEGAAETLYAMGSALTQDGGGDLALIYLNLSVYIRPDFDIAHFLIADIHDRQDRNEEAIAAYSAVSPDSPLSRESEIQAALNLDALERTDDARGRLDALIKKDPNDRTALISAGTMMRARQRFDDALPYYDAAIALIDAPGRNDWQLYYFRGICYERTDAWPLAEKDLLKALELEGEQPLVLNYLGYTWIDLGVHLDEALGMVEKAVEQRPDDGYIVDSLGWAYYRLGDFGKAVEELERAVELRPDDPVINDHLGDAYWRVGRLVEARFQWDHALAMKPEDEDAEKIRAKLEGGLEAVATDKASVAAAEAETANDASGGSELPPVAAVSPAEEVPAVVDKPEAVEEPTSVEDPVASEEPAALVEPAPEEKSPADETGTPDSSSQSGEPAGQEGTEAMEAEGASTEPAADVVASIASPEEQEHLVYTVRAGDTLWDLAREYLGSGALFGLIFDANRDRLRNVSRIFPGDELVIPENP